MFNGCEVGIEKSFIRVAVRPLTTIVDSVSCILFRLQLYLNFYMRYLNNINIFGKEIFRFGSLHLV